jgi:hypothetical protein
MSPSLISTSRRSTLSRVNVLPVNSSRRNVNCLPSSIVIRKSATLHRGLWIVFEGRLNLGRVLNETLRAVGLLQVLVKRLTDGFAIGDIAFVEANETFDELLGKDRVALDLQIANAIELAFIDRNGDTQRLVH